MVGAWGVHRCGLAACSCSTLSYRGWCDLLLRKRLYLPGEVYDQLLAMAWQLSPWFSWFRGQSCPKTTPNKHKFRGFQDNFFSFVPDLFAARVFHPILYILYDPDFGRVREILAPLDCIPVIVDALTSKNLYMPVVCSVLGLQSRG